MKWRRWRPSRHGFAISRSGQVVAAESEPQEQATPRLRLNAGAYRLGVEHAPREPMSPSRCLQRLHQQQPPSLNAAEPPASVACGRNRSAGAPTSAPSRPRPSFASSCTRKSARSQSAPGAWSTTPSHRPGEGSSQRAKVQREGRFVKLVGDNESLPVEHHVLESVGEDDRVRQGLENRGFVDEYSFSFDLQGQNEPIRVEAAGQPRLQPNVPKGPLLVGPFVALAACPEVVERCPELGHGNVGLVVAFSKSFQEHCDEELMVFWVF